MFGNLFKKKAAPAPAPVAAAPVAAAPVAAAPVAAAPVAAAPLQPVAVPAGGFDKPSAPGTIKDVTLRPVVLGINKDLIMTNNPTGKGKVISTPVPSDQFNNYTHVLKIMAQLARIVYCDLSVIREVVIGDAFGKDDNPAVNNQITQLDSKYSSMRRTPVDPAKNEGRPMQSYATPLCPPDQVQPAGSEVLTYVSSPSDVTFLIVGGKHLREKSGIDFFKDDDLVICFKGSSTMKNFKHDLYSQFNATDLNELVQPAGLKLTDNPVGKVTGAFVKPLIKIWATLKREIASKNPKRLFITGHSLGGAYASMFAFIVAECHGSVFPSIQTAHLITFGAPTLLSDTARNTFNKYLDNGFLTLDRVVSQAKTLTIRGVSLGVIDAIPSIPAGFSHPGYQPLKTELFVEEKTGRAYQLKNIEGVFKKQAGGNKRTKKGGLFGFGGEKNKYEAATKVHMPTKIMIDATNPKSQGFPHAEYWGMTYFGGFRMTGMKNSGYKGNTFVGRVYPTCISYAYEPANPTEEGVADPDGNSSIIDQAAPVVSATDEAAPAAATTSATTVATTVATTSAPTAAALNVPVATTVAAPTATPAAPTATPAATTPAATTPAATTSATPVPANTSATPVAVAATSGGRKSRKHRRGNKGRRVSRRKHRKSHAMRH